MRIIESKYKVNLDFIQIPHFEIKKVGNGFLCDLSKVIQYTVAYAGVVSRYVSSNLLVKHRCINSGELHLMPAFTLSTENHPYYKWGGNWHR